MRSYTPSEFRADHYKSIWGIANAGIDFASTKFMSLKRGGDMSRSAVRGLLSSPSAVAGLLVCLFVMAGLHVPAAWGQSSSTGTISITVLDTDGRTVPDAQLTLQDLSTNDVRRGTTQGQRHVQFRQPVAWNLQADGFEGRLRLASLRLGRRFMRHR